MAFRGSRQDTRSLETAASREPRTSFIDASCELSGTLRFCESVQIDGSIDGRIEGEKCVTIGPSGRVRADVFCESIVISGRVEGDIEAKRQITFHKGAQVVGQMKASSIVVEEGSRFKGCIVIGEDEDAAEGRADTAKPLARSGPAATQPAAPQSSSAASPPR